MEPVATDDEFDDGAAIFLGRRLVECKETRGSAYGLEHVQAKLPHFPPTLVSNGALGSLDGCCC